MPDSLIDALSERFTSPHGPGFSIAPGIVTENFDLMSEGRVKVRIPAWPDFEPWARVPSVGGGSSRGFVWMPQVDDEVLVAFAQGDLNEAYVLGGLWSTKDHPPLSSPTDFLSKRVIQTGISSAPGHNVEFDDLLQSITITTSTRQSITMTPLKIQITDDANAISITFDYDQMMLSLQSTAQLEIKAPIISIEGTQVKISGSLVEIDSSGPCTVSGLPIKLN